MDKVRRGDGAAERASLENWRPRKGSASSNLAPSAISFAVVALDMWLTLSLGFLSASMKEYSARKTSCRSST
jgi:hypothetical protein